MGAAHTSAANTRFWQTSDKVTGKQLNSEQQKKALGYNKNWKYKLRLKYF